MVVRFGMCGVGGRAKNYFHKMKRLDWMSMTALCDLNEELLAQWANELDVGQTFTQYRDMLASDIDFVYIATPPATHAAMAIQALEAGQHVLLEVPAVEDEAQARQLADAVRRSGLKFALAENFCYRRDAQAFRKFVRAGEIGRIVFARGNYTHDVRGIMQEHYWSRGLRLWMKDYEWSRYLTHCLGPLVYVTGDDVVRISATSSNGRVTIDDDMQPMIFSATCQTRGGGMYDLLYGAFAPRSDTSMSFTGSKGTIEGIPMPMGPDDASPPLLGDKPYRLTRTDDHDAELSHGIMIDLDPGHPFNTYRGGSHYESDIVQIAAFAECVRDDRAPELDIDFAINVSLAGVAATQSIREAGAMIDVPHI